MNKDSLLIKIINIIWFIIMNQFTVLKLIINVWIKRKRKKRVENKKINKA